MTRFIVSDDSLAAPDSLAFFFSASKQTCSDVRRRKRESSWYETSARPRRGEILLEGMLGIVVLGILAIFGSGCTFPLPDGKTLESWKMFTAEEAP